MLIVSYRPFDSIQPYAEQGPIFLHAVECEAHSGRGGELPEALSNKTECIVRGYGADERMVYGTGKCNALWRDSESGWRAFDEVGYRIRSCALRHQQLLAGAYRPRLAGVGDLLHCR